MSSIKSLLWRNQAFWQRHPQLSQLAWFAGLYTLGSLAWPILKILTSVLFYGF